MKQLIRFNYAISIDIERNVLRVEKIELAFNSEYDFVYRVGLRSR